MIANSVSVIKQDVINTETGDNYGACFLPMVNGQLVQVCTDEDAAWEAARVKLEELNAKSVCQEDVPF